MTPRGKDQKRVTGQSQLECDVGDMGRIQGRSPETGLPAERVRVEEPGAASEQTPDPIHVLKSQRQYRKPDLTTRIYLTWVTGASHRETCTAHFQPSVEAADTENRPLPA